MSCRPDFFNSSEAAKLKLWSRLISAMQLPGPLEKRYEFRTGCLQLNTGSLSCDLRAAQAAKPRAALAATSVQATARHSYAGEARLSRSHLKPLHSEHNLRKENVVSLFFNNLKTSVVLKIHIS